MGAGSKRFGTALALVMVLAIVSAMVIGLWPSPGVRTPGGQGDWLPEASLAGGLQRFASLEELQGFVATTPAHPWRFNGLGGTLRFTADDGAAEGAAPSFSRTNIQVEGVDEADIVKSDGKYIYLAIDNRLIIARASPPEAARVAWELRLAGNIQGLFINGDRLAVLLSEGPAYVAGLRPDAEDAQDVAGGYSMETSIRVYNVTDGREPALDREVSVDGCYVSARMMGDYVYLIASGPARGERGSVSLPRINGDNGTAQIQAEEVWHSETPDNDYSFTTIMSVNMMDRAEAARHETLLAGSASTVYVSPNNIYITYLDWSGPSQSTSIHRIHMARGRMEYQATGEVPGSLLNQFSMDESGGYLRVATTRWDWQRLPSHTGPQQDNRLYVLDKGMDIFGRLESVAPGESIYAARFMGDRCYLVTFEQTDPLFVIDLADPGRPRVLGELVMPGYSAYLHPCGQDHLIGVGMLDASVKISLYDVTDPGSPREISAYLAGGGETDGWWSWSHTSVLSDHRAFLFDQERGLLVLPVTVQAMRAEPGPGSGETGSLYGEAWQGAYVFRVSLQQGLELAGRISHSRDATGNPAAPWPSGAGGESFYRSAIKRSLYIGNVLYTVSDQQIGMNNLETLAQIGKISLD